MVGVAIGGLASNIFVMREMVASQIGKKIDPVVIMNPNIGWMMEFLFPMSFNQIFLVMSLRKVITYYTKKNIALKCLVTHLVKIIVPPKQY